MLLSTNRQWKLACLDFRSGARGDFRIHPGFELINLQRQPKIGSSSPFMLSSVRPTQGLQDDNISVLLSIAGPRCDLYTNKYRLPWRTFTF